MKKILYYENGETPREMVDVPAYGRGLDLTVFEGPFQHTRFYDSMRQGVRKPYIDLLACQTKRGASS